MCAQDEATRLCDWLTGVQWRVRGDDPLTFLVMYPSPSLAEAQLSVLSAVEPEDADTQKRIRVRLCNWRLTHDTVALLASLPSWSSVLDLRSCMWGKDADAAAKQLGLTVPVAYTRLAFPYGRCRPIDSLCEGLNESRAGLELPPIGLSVLDYGVPDAKEGAHVMLTGTTTCDCETDASEGSDDE